MGRGSRNPDTSKAAPAFDAARRAPVDPAVAAVRDRRAPGKPAWARSPEAVAVDALAPELAMLRKADFMVEGTDYTVTMDFATRAAVANAVSVFREHAVRITDRAVGDELWRIAEELDQAADHEDAMEANRIVGSVLDDIGKAISALRAIR